MPTGSLINAVFIIAGSILGIIIKNNINDKYKVSVMQAMGIAVVFIGLSQALTAIISIDEGKLVANHLLLLIISLGIGSVIGQAVDLEKRLEALGDKLKSLTKEKESSFTEGFVNASLLFCVGAMAVVGSLENGLSGNINTLFAKSVIDGICSVILASTYGIGVLFSFIPVLLYQGSITIGAKALSGFFTQEIITQISVVGYALIFVIGINMLLDKKIKVGNMIFSIFIPIIYSLLMLLR